MNPPNAPSRLQQSFIASQECDDIGNFKAKSTKTDMGTCGIYRDMYVGAEISEANN